MKVEMLALLILAVLLLIVEVWALFNVRREWKRAEKTNATCGEWGEKVRPYLRAMQITSVAIAVCLIVAVIVR